MEIRPPFSILRSFLKKKVLTIKIGILHDLVSGGTSAGDVALVAHVSWKKDVMNYFLLKEQLFTWTSPAKMFSIYVCLRLGKCLKFL